MSEEKLKGDWRNINVRRNRKYEEMVEKLCSKPSTFYNKPIFEFNKDLMVFAAVVGYTFNEKESLEQNSIQIVLGTYSSDEKDGFIYLIALLEERKVEVLNDENLHQAVKIFEEYSNGGLSVIQSWLEDNPGDTDGIDTLTEKIFDQLSKYPRNSEIQDERNLVVF